MAVAVALGAPAANADEVASERRSVDARVTSIKLGGALDLYVKQGAPSLVVSGERGRIGSVTSSQRGDMLTLDTVGREGRWGRNARNVRAELTVPNLAEFISEGVGSASVRGFDGESIRIALDGAGAVTVDSRYRHVDARLAGVGALTLNGVKAERVELDLRGAGRIAASGSTRALRARLGGVGSLDAQQLHTDSVDLDMTGLGGASVHARPTANMNLSGLGSATVYGKPATRHANTSGLGKVAWE
jgi:hypothetical protein